MNQKTERVISIKELIKYILNKYIFVGICLLCGAIFLAGMYFLKNRGEDGSVESSTIKYEDMYEDFTDEEKAELQYALYTHERLVEIEKYIENSIYMQLDPYNLQQSTMVFNIELVGYENLDVEEKREMVNQLVSVYYRYVVNGGLVTDLVESGDMPENATSEMLYEVIFAGYDGELEYNGNFYVGTYASDILPGITESIQECISNYSTEMSKSIKHKVTLMDSFLATLKNDSIYNAQRNYYTERNSNIDRAEYAASTLTGDLLTYYNYEIAKQEGENVDESVTVTNASDSGISWKQMIKYGIVGGILGIVGACGLLLFMFMFSKTIVSDADYTLTMGLKYLVKVKSDSNDDDLKFAAVKIKAACKKAEIDKIALISSNKENLENKDKQLSELLSKHNINVDILSAPMLDCDVMGKLFELGNCFIMEKTGVSKYSSVQDMVALCNENNINILGVVDIKK